MKKKLRPIFEILTASIRFFKWKKDNFFFVRPLIFFTSHPSPLIFNRSSLTTQQSTMLNYVMYRTDLDGLTIIKRNWRYYFEYYIMFFSKLSICHQYFLKINDLLFAKILNNFVFREVFNSVLHPPYFSYLVLSMSCNILRKDSHTFIKARA